MLELGLEPRVTPKKTIYTLPPVLVDLDEKSKTQSETDVSNQKE